MCAIGGYNVQSCPKACGLQALCRWALQFALTSHGLPPPMSVLLGIANYTQVSGLAAFGLQLCAARTANCSQALAPIIYGYFLVAQFEL